MFFRLEDVQGAWQAQSAVLFNGYQQKHTILLFDNHSEVHGDGVTANPENHRIVKAFPLKLDLQLL